MSMANREGPNQVLHPTAAPPHNCLEHRRFSRPIRSGRLLPAAVGELIVRLKHMRNAAAFHSIVGKRPWKVWKGVGSFLLFEFGAREKDVVTGTVRGAYCLWIYMAHWRIKRARKEIAHSESSDAMIAKAAETLQGKRLDAVILSCVVTKGELHYVARFEFEGGHSVQAFMEDDHKPSPIFMLHTPSAVFSYDYDGALTESKKKPNVALHRIEARRSSSEGRTSAAGRHR